jgi:hypothetical protein
MSKQHFYHRPNYRIERSVFIRLMSLFLVLFVNDVWALTYYVSTSGSDSSTCADAQNPATPKRWPASPFTAGCVRSGDTVHIAAGTYDDPGAGLARLSEPTINIPSGTASTNTVIEGEYTPGCAVRQDCLTILKATDAFPNNNIEASSYITIRGIKFVGTGTFSTWCLRSGPNSNFVTLEDVWCYDFGSNGWFVDGTADSNTLRRARMEKVGWSTTGSGAHGCYWNGPNGLVEDSQFIDIGPPAATGGGYGIACLSYSESSTNFRFRRNLVDGANGGALAIGGDNTIVLQNAIRNMPAGSAIVVGYNCPTGVRILHNNVYSAAGAGVELGVLATCVGGSANVTNNIILENPGGAINLFNSWTNSGTNNITTGSITDHHK